MKRRHVLLALAALSCGSTQKKPRRRFGSARVRVVVENAMSESFVLVGARLALDDQLIHDRQSEQLAGLREFVVYDGVLGAGEHDLDVTLALRGQGHGVFSYLKGYRFSAKTKQRFDVDGDQRAVVRVVAHERGGPTTPLEERPAIAVHIESE